MYLYTPPFSTIITNKKVRNEMAKQLSKADIKRVLEVYGDFSKEELFMVGLVF